MSQSNLHGEARGALALPVNEDSPSPENRSTSPFWTRPTTYRRSTSISNSQRPPRTYAGRIARNAAKLQRQALKHYNRLSMVQRVLLGIAGVISLVFGILFLVYNERIFAWLAPWAKKWRDVPAGWLILWAMTFVVSFPPLIGYSSCVTIAGFVYGFPNGWFIVASATVVGSSCSFLASRYLLSGFVSRLINRDPRFAALALTLKHDGIKLLIMIRLCPLPYSLSNGAISTIPTVSLASFALATAIVSPKLLLHVFVGAKLGELAEKGEDMDAKTKMISYISIAIGICAGAITGWVIYRQTKIRARQLEEEERRTVRRRSSDGIAAEYADDPSALEAAEALREEQDDISLRETWDEDYGEEDREEEDLIDEPVARPYRDEITDDEDAREMGDAFVDELDNEMDAKNLKK
ncbi:putative exopolygalacturonase B [Venturia nashicola]|uniref:Golgi apparatus membrane protein TVP38 n=1 Tax=Venturia nashicola TaxID=86259 RepID=A0A4Z1NN38_9PEZI|nr:putative exopolygalacturonase B [Venturia nashicola]